MPRFASNEPTAISMAGVVFGRCFEKALGAYFEHQDCTAALFKEWEAFRDTPFEYRKGESWDRLLHQGVHLLEKFVREDRVCVRRPKENLQLKITRALGGGNDFVSYIDAIGELDGKRCLIDWKTTTSRYSEEPDGLLSLDRQLICYSWISGIPDVALVVFVRKQLPEIQYLKASISEEQHKEFGRLVARRPFDWDPPYRHSSGRCRQRVLLNTGQCSVVHD